MGSGEVRRLLRDAAPRVHCLTNPVTMQDVANVLLAAGGSAIMASDLAEVAQITTLCQATLLNTGVPSREKFAACRLAGRKANELAHPVVLDPVGVGASSFRQEELWKLLSEVETSIIRCNQEEACVLLHMESGFSGGVESAVALGLERQEELARRLAKAYGCTAMVSGEADVVSDGKECSVLTGGDGRIRRLTGSGCMLSALCALFSGTGIDAYQAACAAGHVWKESSRRAGLRVDAKRGGMGSFHRYLFDELDLLCQEERGWKD